MLVACAEAAERDQRSVESSVSENVSATSRTSTATDAGGDVQHWRTIAEENARELDALRAECRSKCREIDELLAVAATASGVTDSTVAAALSPSTRVLDLRSPTAGSTAGALAATSSTPTTPSTPALRFASERELQEAMAARDFTYSRERSSWHVRFTFESCYLRSLGFSIVSSLSLSLSVSLVIV